MTRPHRVRMRTMFMHRIKLENIRSFGQDALSQTNLEHPQAQVEVAQFRRDTPAPRPHGRMTGVQRGSRWTRSSASASRGKGRNVNNDVTNQMHGEPSGHLPGLCDALPPQSRRGNHQLAPHPRKADSTPCLGELWYLRTNNQPAIQLWRRLLGPGIFWLESAGLSHVPCRQFFSD